MTHANLVWDAILDIFAFASEQLTHDARLLSFWPMGGNLSASLNLLESFTNKGDQDRQQSVKLMAQFASNSLEHQIIEDEAGGGLTECHIQRTLMSRDIMRAIYRGGKPLNKGVSSGTRNITLIIRGDTKSQENCL